MKTVCIDCRYVAARPSGIAELVRGLVDHAPRLAPDLRFLLLRHPSLHDRLSDAPNVTERVVVQAANGPATMWWLPRIVDLHGVDLLHATFNTMPAGLRMPCVVTIHDIMRLTHPSWCRPGARGEVERLFYGHGIKRALRRAAAIAAVSHATAASIAAWNPPAADRTTVIPSGVSDRFRPVQADAQVQRELGLVPGRAFVLTVGQHAPYKNHEGAVRGFARAFGGSADVDLVLVQRAGPGSRELLALAQRLGIGGRVRILPAVGPEALLCLYAAARALLHPSLNEGFGNPVAEAMACGCPVVTSDLSAMPEVAGGAARLVDPRDPGSIAEALAAVVRDPALAARMRDAGLARARQMRWRDFAAANVTLYRRLLDVPG